MFLGEFGGVASVEAASAGAATVRLESQESQHQFFDVAVAGTGNVIAIATARATARVGVYRVSIHL
ncbi:MAG: hypothetical protein WCE52_02780 [Candidatus Acidiferrum sp.]